MDFVFLKSNTVKKLKLICQNDKKKYGGYSKYTKKDKLIDFILSKNIVEEDQQNDQEDQYNESDDDMGEILSNLFNEPEESINKLFLSRPIKEDLDEIIIDIEKNIKHKNKKNSVVFDIHDDEGNGNMYRIYKHNYYKKYKNLGDELILYHGTDEKNISDILEYGFSLTTAVKHGVLYGKGIYFTNSIDKALSYSEKHKTNKYIIVSIVHIGDIIKGYSEMNMHPKMPNKNKRYDTSVDNIKNPIQYIKKENYTYNILGVLSLKIIGMKRGRLSNCSLRINNTTNENILIYWIPNNVNMYDPNILKLGQYMSTCRVGSHWSCQTFLYHNFICVNSIGCIKSIKIIKNKTIIDI
jgi:hypothetical protein